MTNLLHSHEWKGLFAWPRVSVFDEDEDKAGKSF